MGAVYREELSANARKLIEQLLSLPQGWVTAAALAESIGVSRRTVLRELPAVEQWMQAAGAHFVRNPGKGLLLDEAPERRDALRTQLNSGDRKKLSRAERRQQLLTRLLSEQEPCKTAVLARALGVSESTLSADLDELETKLHPYRVEMFRRPGVGVWLQGGCFFLPEGGVCPAAQQYAGKGTGRGALRTDAGKRDILDPAGYKNGRKGLGGFAAV